MAYLTLQETRDVFMISHTALECSTIEEWKSQVLCLLEHMFKADSIMFSLANRSGTHIDLDSCALRDVDEGLFALYKQYYFKMDPMFKSVESFRPSIVTADEITPYKELVRTEFYNAVLKPWGVHYALNILLKSRKRLLGMFALMRPKHAFDFSSNDKVKAKLLTPFLTGALEKIIALREITEHHCLIKSITEELPFKGIILLDESLEPIFWSEKAQQIILTIYQEKEQREHSCLHLPEQLRLSCQEFKKSASLKKDSKQYQRQFELLRTFGEQMIVHLRLIVQEQNTPLYLIGLEIKDSSADLSLSLFDCLRKLGLTRRETDVISFVYRGFKNVDISDKLCISQSTVENHLNSIYSKLGVNNRTSLVYRLIHLLPPTKPVGDLEK